jgi:hypothetical protein
MWWILIKSCDDLVSAMAPHFEQVYVLLLLHLLDGFRDDVTAPSLTGESSVDTKGLPVLNFFRDDDEAAVSLTYI